MTFRFELGEFVQECISKVKYPQNDRSFCGGINFTEALHLATVGDTTNVAEAEKLVDSIVDTSAEVSRQVWTRNIAGAFPCVPTYLAGQPDCMQHRVMVESESTPVGIYVCTSSSAGVNADQMRVRGVAILALVMKLQMVRPVELYLTSELGSNNATKSTYQVITIPSRPLDLSVASFVLTHVGFPRVLCYEYARVMDGFNGGWPHGKDDNYYSNRQPNQWSPIIRQVLGMPPNDIYVGCADIEQVEAMADGVGWVNGQIEGMRGE